MTLFFHFPVLKGNTILLMLLFVLGTGKALQAQSLQPKDLYSLYSYTYQPGEKILLKKGFDRMAEDEQWPPGTFYFYKQETSEFLDIQYDMAYKREGGFSVTINYYLPAEQSYRAFIRQLGKGKFVYSKKNRTYAAPFQNSYSGQTFTPGGKVIHKHVSCFLIRFSAMAGKELSWVPFPGDSMVKPLAKRYPNTLQNTNWMLQGHRMTLLGKTETQQCYQMLLQQAQDPYGEYVRFKDSIHFESGNIGPCGNECREVVRGRYVFYDTASIILMTDSFSYWKDCAQPTRYHHFLAGNFDVIRMGDTLLLQRSGRDYDYTLKTVQQNLKTFYDITGEGNKTALKYIAAPAMYTRFLKDYTIDDLYAMAGSWQKALQNKKYKILLNGKKRQVWQIISYPVSGYAMQETIEFTDDGGSVYDYHRWKINSYTRQQVK